MGRLISLHDGPFHNMCLPFTLQDCFEAPVILLHMCAYIVLRFLVYIFAGTICLVATWQIYMRKTFRSNTFNKFYSRTAMNFPWKIVCIGCAFVKYSVEAASGCDGSVRVCIHMLHFAHNFLHMDIFNLWRLRWCEYVIAEMCYILVTLRFSVAAQC